MMKTQHHILLVAIILFALPLVAQAESGFAGDLKVGYRYLNEEGSQSVYQPTYNLYEGAAVSLENFSYNFENGTRLVGNLRDLTLNNRNLRISLAKQSRFSLSVTNSQHRRTYNSTGDVFTRRHHTDGNLWVQVHDKIRLFGSYGLTGKKGTRESLLVGGGGARSAVDYAQSYYTGGLQVRDGRSVARAEFRASNFSDDSGFDRDRDSWRFRVTAFSPVPGYEQVQFNVGFQHFENRLAYVDDSLLANTVWAGARLYLDNNVTLRYSAIWDRAHRTNDLVATDNISHALFADKTWSLKGGITYGFRYSVNDDLFDEIKATGHIVNVWFKPMDDLMLKAGFGTEQKNVESGATITGDQSRTKYRASLRYAVADRYTFRVRLDDRQTENDDIGSSADYLRTSSDFRYHASRWGELRVSYSYLRGEYENDAGAFSFNDHIFGGEITTDTWRSLDFGLGGNYARSQQDVDLESFLIRFSVGYQRSADYRMEMRYSAHNFDNLADQSPVYTKYYTANIVEMTITRSF